MSPPEEEFDTIVIGSGIGGLTTAALLARIKNQSVLVLEQHDRPGGFTHTFSRKGRYTWDVGVHYVGGMKDGTRPRKLMDFVSEERLEWSPLPDPHDVFVYPDETFGVPSSRDRFHDRLVDRFPNDESAIDRYFAAVDRARSWYGRYMMVEAFPGFLRWPIDAYNWWTGAPARQTTRDYVGDLTDNEKLQSLLVTNWGDYGLLPSESAFAVHAMVTASYFDGAFYPVGGSERIASSILPTITSRGGECRVNHEVKDVLVTGGQATGVLVEDDEGNVRSMLAQNIVSNAGAHNTYRHLLSDKDHDEVDTIVATLDHLYEGRSFVTLYLGLEQDPSVLGVEGENYWVNSDWNQSREGHNPFEVLRGNPSFSFVSFGPSNDPQAEYATAQVITMAPYEAFEAWADESWPRRSGDYRDLKKRIGDGLLEQAEQAVPGLGDLVEYRDVSTPLSIEHFTGHRKGAPYGVPAVPDRYSSPATGVETPIDNLYLTGADAGCPGVMGAAFSGLFAAGRVMGGIGGPMRAMQVIR